MADGIGHLEIARDRKWEDYRSLKQYFRNNNLEEIIFTSYQTSTNALAEVTEEGGQTLVRNKTSNITVYVRTEADAAGVRDKAITIEYVDEDGAVQTATVNTDDTDSTTEVEIADDFIRLRSMKSEVEAPANNGILLCNADNSEKYGFIQDGRKEAVFSRYYVPALTSGQNTRYFLGRISCNAQTENEGDQVESGHQLSLNFTPKDCSDITLLINFMDILEKDLCIEMEPETEVTIKVKKIADNDHHEIFVQTTMLEVDRIASY